MRACCGAPSGDRKRGDRRPAASPAASLSLSPVASGQDQHQVKNTISPSVRGSPVALSDVVDSPINRCSSEPLAALEHLRQRTGRAALMFRDIRSPARSELLPPSPGSHIQQPEEDVADDGKESFVEIVVPPLPDDARLVNVLLCDGSEVEVDVPNDVHEGEAYIVNVNEQLRRQRRQRFLEEDATRTELLQEIEFLSWSLTATLAVVKIQAFFRNRQFRLAMKQNAAAMMAVLNEARSRQGS